MKKYIVTKEQMGLLFERKKEERKLINEISGKINKVKKNLNETKHGNGIVSILKPYYKKGKITKYVAESLVRDGLDKKLLISARDKM